MKIVPSVLTFFAFVSAIAACGEGPRETAASGAESLAESDPADASDGLPHVTGAGQYSVTTQRLVSLESQAEQIAEASARIQCEDLGYGTATQDGDWVHSYGFFRYVETWTVKSDFVCSGPAPDGGAPNCSPSVDCGSPCSDLWQACPVLNASSPNYGKLPICMAVGSAPFGAVRFSVDFACSSLSLGPN